MYLCNALLFATGPYRKGNSATMVKTPSGTQPLGQKKTTNVGHQQPCLCRVTIATKKMWSLVTRNADWRKRIKHSWFLLFQIWTFTDVVKGPQAGASFGISSRYKRHAGCEIGHSAPSGSYHAVPSYTLHIKIQKKERKTHEDQSSSRHILHDSLQLAETCIALLKCLYARHNVSWNCELPTLSIPSVATFSVTHAFFSLFKTYLF